MEAETNVFVNKTINVDNLDTSTALHLIQAAYKAGFDRIKVQFTEKELINFKTEKTETVADTVNRTIKRLFGMNITHEGPNSIVIEYQQIGNFADIPSVMDEIFTNLKFISENVLVIYKDKK